MKTPHTQPLADRQMIGAVCANQWGADWIEKLTEITGWNPRTVQRLGTDQRPLDGFGLRVLAETLEEKAPSDPGAAAVAQWARRKAAQNPTSDYRRADGAAGADIGGEGG